MLREKKMQMSKCRLVTVMIPSFGFEERRSLISS